MDQTDREEIRKCPIPPPPTERIKNFRSWKPQHIHLTLPHSLNWSNDQVVIAQSCCLSVPPLHNWRLNTNYCLYVNSTGRFPHTQSSQMNVANICMLHSLSYLSHRLYYLNVILPQNLCIAHTLYSLCYTLRKTKKITILLFPILEILRQVASPSHHQLSHS